MATNKTTSKVKGTGKPKRRMKKQVRRTIGALLLASAIGVAAIPVENINANSENPGGELERLTDVNIVRTVHYSTSENNAFETIDGGSTAADPAWQSKVPYIKITDATHDGDTIYVDDSKSFQFAYVPENKTSSERVVVVVGIQNKAISGGTLSIPATVDAYRQYNINTSDGSYCAVTGDGSFLYYSTNAQVKDAEGRIKYDAYIYNYKAKSGSPSLHDRTIDELTGATKLINVYVNPDNPTDASRKFTESDGVTVLNPSEYNLTVEVDSQGNLSSVLQGYEEYTYSEVDEAGQPIPHYPIEDDPSSGDPTYNYDWIIQEPKANPVSARMEATFSPCYLDSKANWFDESTRTDKQLYYAKVAAPDLKNPSDFEEVKDYDTNADKQRIHDVDVKYIGMQRITTTTNSAGDEVWTVTKPTTEYSGTTLVETPENGVFYGNKDLMRLEIKGNLLGIGDYAFYKITNLSSIELSDKLNTIGNGAFKMCSSLSSLSLPSNTNLSIIGASAFEGCTSLGSFQIPHGVEAIGDRAFKGCYSMTSFDMNYDPTQMNLNVIGYNAFEDCSGLRSLEFPNTISQKIPAHYLVGCTSLEYVKANNNQLDIVDGDPRYAGGTDPKKYENVGPDHKHADGDAHTAYHNVGDKYCDIDEWLESLPAEFYFDSNDATDLHRTAKEHSATFKYEDTDYAGDYEVVSTCNEPEHHESTWIVNTNSEIVHVDVNPACKEIVIPAAVGQYGISKLSATTFSNNCSLKKIYIPNTVTSIESGAFAGCHNLEDVIFMEPYNAGLTIQDGAFDTQHIIASGTDEKQCMLCSKILPATTPKLTFTGAMEAGYAPFDYAMNRDNNFNAGFQPRTYITYYSGWPTLLTAQYNYDDDLNELIDYPTLNDISNETWLDSMPFMTADHKVSAKTASGTDPEQRTQDQSDVVAACTDIVLPVGVESIKEGLFSSYKADENSVVPVALDASKKKANTPNVDLKSISMNSVKEIEPFAFASCKNLERVDIVGNTKIGNYAFDGDGALADVMISGDTSEIGIRPFRACPSLRDVGFNGSNFICDNAIIYGLSGGSKSSIVECLETRGQNFAGDFNGPTTVAADETQGVSTIQKEAFMDCDYIIGVELPDTNPSVLPERTFAACNKLSSVYLPDTLRTIGQDAFVDTPNLSKVSIPNTNTQIFDQYVFALTKNFDKKRGSTDPLTPPQMPGYPSASTEQRNAYGYTSENDNPYLTDNEIAAERSVTLYTPDDSAASYYAENHVYLTSTATAVEYDVYFWDPKADDLTIPYDKQTVTSGGFATKPILDPSHDGYTFQGWSLNGMIVDVTQVPITTTTNFSAIYDGDQVTVTFYDYDFSTILNQQTIAYGGNAATPPAPHRDGYTFTGWMPEYTNVTSNLSVYAQYEKIDTGDKHHVIFYNYDDTVISEQYVADGESATTPSTPTRAGYTFTGWKPADFTNVTSDMNIYAYYEKNNTPTPTPSPTPSPNPSGNNNKTPTGNNNGGGGKPTHTVTVINGSGSGTYEEGSTVIIAANDPASGKAFDKWTTGDVSLASTSLPATTFTMPNKNVTVTANYKDGAKNNSTTVRAATGNSTRPISTGQTAKGNTSVVVSKGGVSNIDLASATVRGSTDNFIIKVTETNEATTQVENALNNRYGSLNGLQYWACDISLYDSTGNTKITDTTGLTVDITLPIPDALRSYGGNNKAGAVANNQLENLNTKFNTINGTPTVTFTATHFSPYVIYADTNNLVADQMLDASPKTGDPIHPKWFLALGLFAASIIMFLKKDKKRVSVATI